ncbi:prenyltransferase subunit beta [Encephalitozoon hellem ATCC 50504]|uniref:Geranylgeranyl transferase type-2 subunit beta n=1 Tax=Encephalitozoon hellem TaxID=27973 RepID=A0A9Q9FA33_ENCHE|nr:prenyltransferase subunit beta [Encephalitozoon hellem ATCC 50504]AFM98829.1 prenyltransferase subunit beta [Encephalitozoon hellem ATCC 50504]UTX43807.1 geranylgeranyl transferase subunit beta [Encephalitozoon hellem]|eukprot:XP_003887810.1 prenyltransferase subunit beta [Encephalitozoon hellem ATCC 50504]
MELKVDEHFSFIQRTIHTKNLLYYLTEPSRLNTIYWSVNSLSMLGMEEVEEMKSRVVDYVMRCRNEDGGFGGCAGYSSNITSTFNALQILYIYRIHYSDRSTVSFISKLLQPEGYFYNDIYGEIDTRINCCAVLGLHLLSLLEKGDFDSKSLSNPICGEFLSEVGIDTKAIVLYTQRCYNLDGGFGAVEGAESHAAQVFCCLSTLRSLGALGSVDVEGVTRFIAMKQTSSGGLSGRVSKKEDVCYSFWAYSSLVLIGRESHVNQKELAKFIFSCQGRSGGFSDRPGNEADLYHLMFALAGLSLLGYKGVKKIDPGFGL